MKTVTKKTKTYTIANAKRPIAMALLFTGISLGGFAQAGQYSSSNWHTSESRAYAPSCALSRNENAHYHASIPARVYKSKRTTGYRSYIKTSPTEKAWNHKAEQETVRSVYWKYEAALNLDRYQKGLVQKGLSYVTGKRIQNDGIIGKQTRHAIKYWQAALNLKPTGYLSAKQAKYLISKARSVSGQRYVEQSHKKTDYIEKVVENDTYQKPLYTTEKTGGVYYKY